MDGFNGYNQIKMDPCNAKKTAFQLAMDNFHYTVVPFGFKNAGATYQHVMTVIFQDILPVCLEYYVDNAVVKS